MADQGVATALGESAFWPTVAHAQKLNLPVTDADIEREFQSRLRVAERGVERNVKAELTQAQFDASVSFAYNAGVDGSSKVFERLNAGDFEDAANAIAAKNFGHERRKRKKVKVVYPGLVARRADKPAPFRNASNAPLRSVAR